MPKQRKIFDEASGHDMPLLPLRDVVVYPNMVIPLFVGREKSIEALDKAMEEDKRVLLVAQKSAEQDNPTTKDLYEVGTLATILQMLKLPDGTVKVLVEGLERIRLLDLNESGPFLTATYDLLAEEGGEQAREVEVLMHSVLTLCDQYIKLNKKYHRKS